MKKFRILIILCILAVFSACEEYLDVNPNMGVSSEDVYSDYHSFRGAIDLAARLINNPANTPISTQGYRPGSYSDEGQCDIMTRPMGSHNLGNFTWEIADAGFRKNSEPLGNISNNTPSGSAVQGIRAMNQALANIDLLTTFPPETEYSVDELKNQLLGQCYYFRAFHYFELIRRMGALPKMDVVFNSDDNFDVERPSYQESTEYLVEDLDLAIQMLPDGWNNQNKGRPTKTSARALKAMALLYAASPNMVHTDFKNGIFNPALTSEYSTAYLEKAVAASVEAIKSAESSPEYRMYNWDEISEVWTSKTEVYSKEAIVQPPVSTHTGNWGNQDGNSWFRPGWDGGWNQHTIYPTQNIVDKFETIDGWDINDAPDVSFNPKDPYENRDPRLREWIFVEGDYMYLKPNVSHGTLESFVSFDPEVANGYHYEYMEQKGLVWTGFALKGKHRWEGCNTQDKVGVFRYFAWIRFPQLYLDLAEAANELYGPGGSIPGASTEWNTAVKAINIVRNRANMPNVRAAYSSNKELFRERVRNERAVELFWEGHRWHDIKRWRIAKDVLSEIKAADVVFSKGEMLYGSKTIPNVRVFDDKHYWYPFSQSVEDMMLTFKQNPGW